MQKTLSTLLCAALIGTIAALTGCETDPTEQIALSITPNTARLRAGESQEFKAGGFQDYTWSLSKPELGVLSTTKGDTTIYTQVSSASSETQVLTVRASSTGASASNKVTTASAEAIITNY